MNRSSSVKLLASLALTLTSAAAGAHDYWLEPTAAEDGSATLRLFVGECLKADEEKRYESTRTTRLEAWTATETTDLRSSAQDDAQPLLGLPASEAQRLIVFERNVSYIELAPKKFDDYLKEEGLEAVRAERRKSGESDKPGRERYLRFLKTLLPGAPGEDPISNQSVGQTLELVPMEDPGELKPGERLHVRLLLEDVALPDAKVELCVRNPAGKIKILAAVTDSLGDAGFTVPGPGLALVRAVHMHRVTDDDPKADWESLWTSYSFYLRGK